MLIKINSRDVYLYNEVVVEFFITKGWINPYCFSVILVFNRIVGQNITQVNCPSAAYTYTTTIFNFLIISIGNYVMKRI